MAVLCYKKTDIIIGMVKTKKRQREKILSGIGESDATAHRICITGKIWE